MNRSRDNLSREIGRSPRLREGADHQHAQEVLSGARTLAGSQAGRGLGLALFLVAISIITTIIITTYCYYYYYYYYLIYIVIIIIITIAERAPSLGFEALCAACRHVDRAGRARGRFPEESPDAPQAPGGAGDQVDKVTASRNGLDLDSKAHLEVPLCNARLGLSQTQPATAGRGFRHGPRCRGVLSLSPSCLSLSLRCGEKVLRRRGYS